MTVRGGSKPDPSGSMTVVVGANGSGDSGDSGDVGDVGEVGLVVGVVVVVVGGVVVVVVVVVGHWVGTGVCTWVRGTQV
ncbi:hypothetical protein A5757_14590 [Mycobacterium sp. 852013-51886_SCH5428379]|nr:hypothetical protein A5757_14590 [Mycobacterium sp. 852013-51886_SCH5428379]